MNVYYSQEFTENEHRSIHISEFVRSCELEGKKFPYQSAALCWVLNMAMTFFFWYVAHPARAKMNSKFLFMQHT